jgi:glycosyltransferase involved in cell wall biosynthesis
MSDNSLVSICVPSFNHARYLPAALESALSQSYSNIEIIVVDDGSTDDSLEIAQSYAAKYPALIKVFTHPGQRNLGISATVNLGFQMARGEYYSGLPSDDLLYPDKIERQVRFLKNNPSVDWVYGYADLIDASGKRLAARGLLGEDITRDANPLERLVKKNVIPGMAVLMRRKSIEQIGPHDEALVYSDWDFWIRLLAHSKAGFIDRPLVRYRVHGRNTSFGADLNLSIRRGLEVMEKIRRQSLRIGGGLLDQRVQALLDLQLAYHLFLLNDEARAAQSLRSAFESDPSLRGDANYLTSWLLTPKLYDSLNRAGEYDFKVWTLRLLPAVMGEADANRVLKRCRRRLATESLFYKSERRRSKQVMIDRFLRDPRLLSNRALRLILLESLAGPLAARHIRNFRNRVLNWQQ